MLHKHWTHTGFPASMDLIYIQAIWHILIYMTSATFFLQKYNWKNFFLKKGLRAQCFTKIQPHISISE